MLLVACPLVDPFDIVFWLICVMKDEVGDSNLIYILQHSYSVSHWNIVVQSPQVD